MSSNRGNDFYSRSHSQAHTSSSNRYRVVSHVQEAGQNSLTKPNSRTVNEAKDDVSSSARLRRPALERMENPALSPVTNTASLLNHTGHTSHLSPLVKTCPSLSTEGRMQRPLQARPHETARPSGTAFGELGEGSGGARNKRPALERIENPSPTYQRTLQSGLKVQAGPSINSADLQEVTVQYANEETNRSGEGLTGKNSLPSTAQKSPHQSSERIGIHQRLSFLSTEEMINSPIEGLEGLERPPVANRLEQKVQPKRRVTQQKSSGKGIKKASVKKRITPAPKLPKASSKVTVPCSPLQGANSRTRNTVRQKKGTKKKLYVDTLMESHQNVHLPLNEVDQCNMNITAPSKTLMSSSVKGSVVFQKPPNVNQ